MKYTPPKGSPNSWRHTHTLIALHEKGHEVYELMIEHEDPSEDMEWHGYDPEGFWWEWGPNCDFHYEEKEGFYIDRAPTIQSEWGKEYWGAILICVDYRDPDPGYTRKSVLFLGNQRVVTKAVGGWDGLHECIEYLKNLRARV